MREKGKDEGEGKIQWGIGELEDGHPKMNGRDLGSGKSEL